MYSGQRITTVSVQSDDGYIDSFRKLELENILLHVLLCAGGNVLLLGITH